YPQGESVSEENIYVQIVRMYFLHHTSSSSTLANVDILSRKCEASSSSSAGILCTAAAVEMVIVASLKRFKIGPCSVSTCCTRIIGMSVRVRIKIPCCI